MTKPIASQPKPTKIVRKLKLSKQKVAQLTGEHAPRCTKRVTGCPVHTC